MNIQAVEEQGVRIAVVSGNGEMTSVQDALDLMMTAYHQAQTDRLAIAKSVLAEDFFKLSTGLAGEILQKFVNYRIRAAIFGDFSGYTSKPLQDFIRESNKGNSVFFVETQEEALSRLAKIG